MNKEGKLISDSITDYLKSLEWSDEDIEIAHNLHKTLINIFEVTGIPDTDIRFPEVLRSMALGMDLGHEILRKNK